MINALLLSLLLVSCDQTNIAGQKELLREKIGPLIGQEWTLKLLGKAPTNIKLPPIPKIEKDATSTDVYKKGNGFKRHGEAFEKLTLEEKRKYRLAFIQELYEVTRNTRPKEEDVLNFLNVLEQGGSREGVYRAIVLDSVYASLESFEEAPSSELKEFAVKFGQKYLARKFSEKAMSKLNLWSIKRIIVEKALEVMEAMEHKPEDLRSWYAVLSEELAKKSQNLWKNDVRRSEDRDFHYRWSGQVPLQQVKSETIIKLHTTMNGLSD